MGRTARRQVRVQRISTERLQKTGDGDREGARYARMRRCLILRQGASPLRPARPLCLNLRFWGSGAICQGFATPAKTAALDRSLRFPEIQLRRGKGALQSGPTASRGRPRRGSNRGAKSVLDKYRPSHGRRKGKSKAKIERTWLAALRDFELPLRLCALARKKLFELDSETQTVGSKCASERLGAFGAHGASQGLNGEARLAEGVGRISLAKAQRWYEKAGSGLAAD